MVEAINSIRQVGAADMAARTIPAAAAAPAPAAAVHTTEPLYPRLTTDFLAGKVVMEVNAGGDQRVTLPSAAALAYLRAGLNEQGQTVVDPYAPNEEPAALAASSSDNEGMVFV